MGDQVLQRALDYASARGTIAVAAAGNDGTIGSSAITGHPGVIPVAGCTSLGTRVGKPLSLSGTSVAAPFVTGAIALIWPKVKRFHVTALLPHTKPDFGTRHFCRHHRSARGDHDFHPTREQALHCCLRSSPFLRLNAGWPEQPPKARG